MQPVPHHRQPPMPAPRPPAGPTRLYRLLFGLSVLPLVAGVCLWYAAWTTAPLLGGKADQLASWGIYCGIAFGVLWLLGVIGWWSDV